MYVIHSALSAPHFPWAKTSAPHNASAAQDTIASVILFIIIGDCLFVPWFLEPYVKNIHSHGEVDISLPYQAVGERPPLSELHPES